MSGNKKYEHLKTILKGYGSVAIAYSGGVDSTFLLYTAREALGDRALAITATAPFFPGRESMEAEAFCRQYGIKQIKADVNTLEIEGIRENPPNRCYLCKHTLFGKILQIAAENGLNCVADGSNMDDTGDYRPGMKALEELQVCSPLREAGLYKEEIRALSRELGLPTWNKPSFACLASRLVYGETITAEKLSMIDRAEQLLLDLGFTQVRVRLHGTMARIEILPEEFPRLIQQEIRETVTAGFRETGFSYVTLDLAGYRTGSMNETLKI